MKKINDWIRKVFKPVQEPKKDTAIEDKIIARRKEQEVESKIHIDFMNELVREYFSKKYFTQEEMYFSFNLFNKKWQKRVRQVNSTSKLINLNKEAFKEQVKLVINQIKKDKQ